MTITTASVASCLIISLLITAPVAEAQPTYTPRGLFFTVYSDGFVLVDYDIEVDPTRATVNVTLFGSLFQDLTADDQDGLPLDYAAVAGGLTIDTLGSTSVLISYVTPDLTNKTAQIWTFFVSGPVPPDILLPSGATVVGLSAIPLAVGSLDSKPLLTMPAGYSEVSYVVGVEGTREYVLAVIKDAESAINSVKGKSVKVGVAEALLQQANTAFNAVKYAEAEQLAGQAKSSALSAEKAAASAQMAMDAANASIATARSAGRTTGLDQAESLLQQAKDAHNVGDYNKSKGLAEQAKEAAEKATTGISPYVWVVVGITAATISLVFTAYLLRRRKPKSAETEGALDLEVLFQKHRGLRFEDREVLKFLAESGGEAFASEIRDRFDMPRTSAWRMIQRLQKEGVVEVRDVGGQSMVRVSQRYRRKRGG